MRRSKQLAAIVTLAFVAVLANATYTFAQGNITQVPSGQKAKIVGIIIRRDADSFQMKDQASGAVTVVALTPMTVVKTSKGGIFGTSKTYGVSYLLRGLRTQAEGVGDANGQLVASKITFDERDLRTAQALQQTDEMARENQARIAAEEENAKKLAGQIAENQALANQAQASADAAQKRADEAAKSADRANSRINGLDDYDIVRTWSILFRPGSAILSLKAKQQIDAGAAWVKTQNTRALFFLPRLRRANLPLLFGEANPPLPPRFPPLPPKTPTPRPPPCSLPSFPAPRVFFPFPLNFAQTPLEKSTFTLIGHQRERSLVALRRFRHRSEPAQQIGARRMQQVIVLKFARQRID